MKKVLLLLSILFFGSVVYADTSIGDVSVFFCNTGQVLSKQSSFFIQAGKKYPVCLRFLNESSHDVALDFSFVEGLITADASHNKACGVQTGIFSKFVQFPSSRVYLKGKEKYSLTGILQFPLGFSGRVHGCLVYNLVSEKKSTSNPMFSVITRRANFFDGYVVSDFKRKVSLGVSGFSYELSGGKLFVSFPLINRGTVDEIASLSGVISNTLGYERVISGNQLVEYGSSAVLLQVIDDIPFYKSMYFLSGSVSFRPNVNFDIVSFPEKLYQDMYSDFFFRLFLVPWGLFFGFVAIVFVVFLLRKKWRK